MAITKHVQHPKSSATTVDTQGVTVPRLPSSGDLLHGEIAVNYREGYETLSIRNSANGIVTFTPSNRPTIETDAALNAVTGSGSVTISSNIFSANTDQGTVLYKMTPNGSANTASRAEHTTVFGARNTAEGSTAAAAFGVGNALCGGTGSFVEGSGNTVSASAAHAAGIGTEAKNNGEFACGAYNISSISTDASGKTAFSIGFGTSGTRKNAFEVRMDGKVYINDLNTGNMVCLQDLLGI